MDRKPRILFLCTANCCRSQMAEAILKHIASDRIEVLSAGSTPAGYIHPLVFDALEQLGIPVENQTSKSWEEFRDSPPDLLITVCESAAGEVCPVWPDCPATAHWPLPDPVMLVESEQDRIDAARRVAERLQLKLQRLAQLDWEHKSPQDLLPQIEQLRDL